MPATGAILTAFVKKWGEGRADFMGFREGARDTDFLQCSCVRVIQERTKRKLNKRERKESRGQGEQFPKMFSYLCNRERTKTLLGKTDKPTQHTTICYN